MAEMLIKPVGLVGIVTNGIYIHSVHLLFFFLDLKTLGPNA